MPNLTSEMQYWIRERERIRKLKEAGAPPPWSIDPVFQTTRFCNVRREDDKVTKWFRTKWNGRLDSAKKFVLGRLFNLPESLEIIEKDVNLREWGAARSMMKGYRDAGNKIFTSAYTVSTCGKKMDKVDYVFDLVGKVTEPSYNSLVECYRDLTKIDGLGSFLAGQVIADMKNTYAHPLYDAPDWQTWSTPGPGSLRGLNWYFHGAPEGSIKPHNYQKFIKICYEEVMPALLREIGDLHMQDFQSCLCEYSKYAKISRDFNGHRRNKFKGAA
jgi:hypothetical protein